MPDFSKLLEDDVEYADFARKVGEHARIAGERNGLFQWLLESLIDALFQKNVDPSSSIENQFKIVLGLSLIIACDSDEVSQQRHVEQAFFNTLDRAEGQKISNETLYYFLLCELTYLDQFLKSSELRSQLDDKLKRHFRDSMSPAYVDYKAGWEITRKIQRLHKRYKPNIEEQKDIQIILVGSVKGGVGKTLISLSLAYHLLKNEQNAKIALLDLDSSGPTVQYNLDVSAVSAGLSARPTRSSAFKGMRWTYPTFGDLIRDPIFEDPLDSNRTVSSSERPSSQALLLAIKEKNKDLKSAEDRLRVIVLPDSPIVAGVTVSARYFNSLESADVLVAIDSIMTGRNDSQAPSPFKFNYLIVDLGPGLFGTNGSLFTWLTQRYPTSLLLVTSPRTFDIATSLYESVWLSAPNYLRWDRPILQLLNMWPSPLEGIKKKLGERANSALDTVLAADFAPHSKKAKLNSASDNKSESTDYIMFWRLRAYLYIIAAEASSGEIANNPEWFGSRYNIRSLQYDNELRRLLHVFDLKPLDMNSIMGTDWYKLDFDNIISSWLKARTYGVQQ